MKKLLLAVLLTFAAVTAGYAAATKFTELEASTMTVTNRLTAGSVLAALPVVDITVSSPTVAGALVRTSAYVVYIGTNTTNLQGWVKVGAQ